MYYSTTSYIKKHYWLDKYNFTTYFHNLYVNLFVPSVYCFLNLKNYEMKNMLIIGICPVNIFL